MIIQLETGDPRTGTHHEDGSIAAWPEVDVFGREYERVNATVQRIAQSDLFVVVPPDGSRRITEIRAPISAEAPTEPSGETPADSADHAAG